MKKLLLLLLIFISCSKEEIPEKEIRFTYYIYTRDECLTTGALDAKYFVSKEVYENHEDYMNNDSKWCPTITFPTIEKEEIHGIYSGKGSLGR